MISDGMSVKIRDRGPKGVYVRVRYRGREREFYVGKGPGARELAEQRREELLQVQALDELWDARSFGLPIDKALESWRVNHAGLRSWRSRRTDASRIARLVRFFGDKDLAALTTEDLRRFTTTTVASGVSGWTAAGCIALLQRVWNLATEEDGIQPRQTPKFSEVRRVAERLTSSEEGRDAWTLEEVQKLLQAARKVSPRDFYPALAFALGTGARRGEILGLRWQDVDLERRRVQIRQIPTGEKGGKTKGPKTGARTTPLSDEMLELLVEQRGARVPLPTWVFPAPKGGAWIERNFTRTWMRVRDRAAAKGVRPLPFHCTRHTAISLMLANGVRAKRVSESCGVSLQVLEKHYAHAMPAEAPPPNLLGRKTG